MALGSHFEHDVMLARVLDHLQPKIVIRPYFGDRRMINLQRFDFLGLAFLVVAMVCWEVSLSKGQEWDWFGDPFHRIHILAAIFIVSLIGLIYRELHYDNPLIQLRTLRDRNFRACCIIIFCAYGVLYASSTSLPALLQSLFGYDALSAGLVMSPAGFFAVVAMPFVARVLDEWPTATVRVYSRDELKQSEMDERLASGSLRFFIGDVRDALFAKKLKPGDFLGTEKDLAARFKASRIVARDALRTLEALGIVEIRMGKGGGARIACGILE